MATILVIDDNGDYRETLAELLSLEAYTSLEAENGQTGLKMIRRYLPELILCDMDMPGMNGIEVLAIVKADPVLAHIPFFIITASSDEQAYRKAVELGVDAYLSKSIELLALLSSIANTLKLQVDI